MEKKRKARTKILYIKPHVLFVPLKPEERILACCKINENKFMNNCPDCLFASKNEFNS